MSYARLGCVSAFALVGVAAAVSSADNAKPVLIIENAGGNVAFSPDGKWLAGAVPGTTWRPTDIKMWNASTGDELFVMKGHTSNIWQLSFSRDGKRLATNQNWRVKIWDLETRKEIKSWDLPAFTRNVIFDGDGKQVITGSDDARIRIWNVETGRSAQTLKGHTDWVPGLALSPDGTRLASGGLDMTVKHWDLVTGKAIHSLTGHKWYVGRVAFGPEGKRIVSASDDTTAKVWSLETGKELVTLRGHSDWVRNVAFSPDGKWVATASNDKTARLWNASTGQLVRTLTAHTDEVFTVAFRPDGKRLVTAGADKIIQFWDVAALTDD